MNPTDEQLNQAINAWVCDKPDKRYVDFEDRMYFLYNWRSLPGLRSYVETVCNLIP